METKTYISIYFYQQYLVLFTIVLRNSVHLYRVSYIVVFFTTDGTNPNPNPNPIANHTQYRVYTQKLPHTCPLDVGILFLFLLIPSTRVRS